MILRYLFYFKIITKCYCKLKAANIYILFDLIKHSGGRFLATPDIMTYCTCAIQGGHSSRGTSDHATPDLPNYESNALPSELPRAPNIC